MEDNLQKLQLPDGDFIAYYKHEGKKNHPSIVFLGGFMSDMTGTKATELHKFCIKHNYNFIRFDYFGHGQSSHKFTDCTISNWRQNVLDVLDKLTDGKQILIGSSMGGWLMLLAAIARPKKIAALIGIASAPDFTEELIWEKMSALEQKELQEKGVFNLKSEYGEAPYPITMKLIEDGRKHLLLREKGIGKREKLSKESPSPTALLPSPLPIRLIHGLLDQDVPSSFSTRLGLELANHDIKVKLVEDGDHRMSTPENIQLLCDTLGEIISKNW